MDEESKSDLIKRINDTDSSVLKQAIIEELRSAECAPCEEHRYVMSYFTGILDCIARGYDRLKQKPLG